MERKVDEKENKEIKEILNAQAIIDEILVANSDAIKRIDKEIQNIIVNKDLTKDSENAVPEEEAGKKTKKCKYFNRGYCKYKLGEFTMVQGSQKYYISI